MVEADNFLQEVRVTDPLTGGQKGSKLARFSLIPAEFLWALAEHYGIGARKYEDRNWERGYKWSLSVDALERHLNQWKLGEDRDPETGSHHLIAVAWHTCALFIFGKRNLGTDDVRTQKRAALNADAALEWVRGFTQTQLPSALSGPVPEMLGSLLSHTPPQQSR